MEALTQCMNALTINNSTQSLITSVAKHLETNTNPKIKLLKNIEVIQWLFADTSFLKYQNQNPEQKTSKKNETDEKKKLEDAWGRGVMKALRPDLKLEGQWTNRFGEYLCEELFLIQGCIVSKPEKKERFQPDLQTDDAVLEAKAQTFFTTGTASEKILGVPLKYADIPELYGKPLKVICLGGAEVTCRNFGCFNDTHISAKKRAFIDFYRQNNIEYVAATDILRRITSTTN